MANKKVRRLKSTSRRNNTESVSKKADDAAKFLLHMNNVARQTRKSERRRILLEGEKKYGTSE
jgi:hypothetical protein